MHPHAPVVALDIDGTLGQYHEHFHDFAELWTGRKILLDWEGTGGKFYKALGMSKTNYRQCKLAFRQGGMKRSMPVFDGAAELTRAIRKRGVQVWICTTRPYLRLDNVDPDTRHWLRRNGIQFDGVLYGERKYKDLVKIVGLDRVIAVVDDLPEQILAADALGLNTYLKHHPHNLEWRTSGSYVSMTSVPNLHYAEEEILLDINEWKSGKEEGRL